MGDKYIIELEDKPFHKEDGDFLYRVKGFNSLVFDMTDIGKLIPYPEPDLEQVRADAYLKGLNDGQGVILESTQNNAFNNGYKKCLEDMEQVRKEAYQNGYETGYEDGYNEPGKNQQEAYQRGLNDAWEAASEIAVIPYVELEKIFGATGWHIFMKCTASEVIEKIKAWEEKKHVEIKVGDEVELKCGVSPAIYMQGTKGSDEIYLLFNDGSCGPHSKSEIERKTGRHFPEIATILEKMRGEQDG